MLFVVVSACSSTFFPFLSSMKCREVRGTASFNSNSLTDVVTGPGLKASCRLVRELLYELFSLLVRESSSLSLQVFCPFVCLRSKTKDFLMTYNYICCLIFVIIIRNYHLFSIKDSINVRT